MLLSRAEKAFDSPDYVFELKFDGVRMLAYCGDGDARLVNRRGHGRTNTYTEIAAELKNLNRKVVLDGEIIALNADGRPDFYRLLKRDRVEKPSARFLKETPVRYAVFDLLASDGKTLTERPWQERRKVLERLFAGANFANIELTDVFPSAGEALFQAAARENLEGIVAKRSDGQYFPGRRAEAWIKIKNPNYQRPRTGNR